MTFQITTLQGRMPTSINGPAMLLKAKEGNRQKGSLVNIMLQDWPVTQNVIAALGAHIGDGLMVKIGKTNHAVVHVIVDYAVDRYIESISQVSGAFGKTPDIKRLAVFVGAIVEKSCELLPTLITDKASGNSWHAASPVSYPAWYRRTCKQTRGGNCIGCTLDLNIEPAGNEADAELREALYQIITDERIQELLKRGGYEKDLVAGPDAARG